jgi:hypothetical protein
MNITKESDITQYHIAENYAQFEKVTFFLFNIH